MKVDATMVWEALRYWMKNGKSMTALWSGLAIAFFGSSEVELTPEQMALVKELLPLVILFIVGQADKVRKGIVRMMQYFSEKEAEVTLPKMVE